MSPTSPTSPTSPASPTSPTSPTSPASPTSSLWREVSRITARTLFYFLLLLAVLLLWRGSGLFIYEGF